MNPKTQVYIILFAMSLFFFYIIVGSLINLNTPVGQYYSSSSTSLPKTYGTREPESDGTNVCWTTVSGDKHCAADEICWFITRDNAAGFPEDVWVCTEDHQAPCADDDELYSFNAGYYYGDEKYKEWACLGLLHHDCNPGGPVSTVCTRKQGCCVSEDGTFAGCYLQRKKDISGLHYQKCCSSEYTGDIGDEDDECCGSTDGQYMYAYDPDTNWCCSDDDEAYVIPQDNSISKKDACDKKLHHNCYGTTGTVISCLDIYDCCRSFDRNKVGCVNAYSCCPFLTDYTVTTPDRPECCQPTEDKITAIACQSGKCCRGDDFVICCGEDERCCDDTTEDAKCVGEYQPCEPYPTSTSTLPTTSSTKP